VSIYIYIRFFSLTHSLCLLLHDMESRGLLTKMNGNLSTLKRLLDSLRPIYYQSPEEIDIPSIKLRRPLQQRGSGHGFDEVNCRTALFCRERRVRSLVIHMYTSGGFPTIARRLAAMISPLFHSPNSASAKSKYFNRLGKSFVTKECPKEQVVRWGELIIIPELVDGVVYAG
jgi:hypothetical protein